ncbi:hypothetical protein IQ244_28025 [Nostoc sp. LEGE 06077]|nr:hypothetical protein [Nostoc sp. LEGE 06077]
MAAENLTRIHLQSNLWILILINQAQQQLEDLSVYTIPNYYNKHIYPNILTNLLYVSFSSDRSLGCFNFGT